MAIPHALRELTQRLRTDVEKANANNWELLHKTAWTTSKRFVPT